MTLLDGVPGRPLKIRSVDGPLATRLAEIGLAPGVEVAVVGAVAFGGPLILERAGFRVALRRDDARAVGVEGEAP